MAGMLRVPRSRGALSGALLFLLGLWGGLIAFVGPYFHFAYTPGTAWTYTSGRLWLEILPGIATALGGLILLASRGRGRGGPGAQPAMERARDRGPGHAHRRHRDPGAGGTQLLHRAGRDHRVP